MSPNAQAPKKDPKLAAKLLRKATARSETPEQRAARHGRHSLHLGTGDARKKAKLMFGRLGDVSYDPSDRQTPCRVGRVQEVVLTEGRYRGIQKRVVGALHVKGAGLTWAEAFSEASRFRD